MLIRGIPETLDEAQNIVKRLAEHTPNDPQPAHWPHSQIVALSRLVIVQQDQIQQLLERTDKLRAEIIDLKRSTAEKRGPGRPRKSETELAAV